MKNMKTKNIWRKLIPASLVLCLAITCAVVFFPRATVSADGAGGTASAYSLGAAALSDPVYNESTGAYDPTAYVYFGDYTLSNGERTPILWRVLDADADNTGAEGAAFVLTENVDSTYQWDDYGLRWQLDRENKIARYQFNYNGSSVDAYLSRMLNRSFPSGISGFIREVTKADGLPSDSFKPASKTFEGNAWRNSHLSFKHESYTADAQGWLIFSDYLEYVESENILNGDKFFLLSAEEVEKYVSKATEGQGLAAINVRTGEYSDWWLRSASRHFERDVNEGINEEESYEQWLLTNNYVGIIKSDASGYASLDAEQPSGISGIRYGANLELDSIAYTELVGTNTYRIAFNDASMQNFRASVSDIVYSDSGNTVYIDYSGAYLHYVGSTYGANGYVSVMIKGTDGAIKYYERVEGSGWDRDENGDVTGSTSFTLPSNYSYEDGDKVLVFSELFEYEGDPNQASSVSNMVTLDCVHPSSSTQSDCVTLKTCSACGVEFGGYADVHDVDYDKFYFNEDTDEHWYQCVDCEKQFNVRNCYFSAHNCSQTGSCVCGNTYFDGNEHSFNKYGICVRDDTHYEKPDFDPELGTYSVTNEGNILWLAQAVDGGELDWSDVNIVLMNDLTIDGAITLGTESKPFTGSIDGNGYTLRWNYVGNLFGYTNGASFTELVIDNLVSSGCVTVDGEQYCGALVNHATDTEITNCIAKNIGFSTNTEDAHVGAFIGYSAGETSINSSYVYNVSDGKTFSDVSLCGNGAAAIDNSYYLVEDSEEEGNGAVHAKRFASGEIAYLLNEGSEGTDWQQDLRDGESLPTFGNIFTVYRSIPCVEGAEAHYSNLDDVEGTTHNYTEFLSGTEGGDESDWVWIGFEYCNVRTRCADCGQENPDLVQANVTFMAFGGVRVEAVAVVTLGDTRYESDVHMEFGKRIEDMSAVEAVTRAFDGSFVDPEIMMTNTRLEADDYSAYFYRLDEEGNEIIYRGGAQSAGTYSLRVVGKGDYEYQSCTYEDVLTITPIEVTVTVFANEKIWDGTPYYEIGYVANGVNSYDDWLVITPDEFSETEVGNYEIGFEYALNEEWIDNGYYDDNGNWVSEYVNVYEAYAESVTITEINETFTFKILPRNFVYVINKDYPTHYIYGVDEISAPTEDDFEFDEGSSLTFTWFRLVEGYYMRVDAPTDVGDYVLRVVAAPTETLYASTYEFDVKVSQQYIEPRFHTDALTPVSEYEGKLDFMYEVYVEETVYVLPYGSTAEFFVYDANGNALSTEQLADMGIELSYRMNCSTHSASPHVMLDNGYPRYCGTCLISLTLSLSNTNNYEGGYTSLCFYYVDVPEVTVENTNTTYTGDAVGIDLTFAIDAGKIYNKYYNYSLYSGTDTSVTPLSRGSEHHYLVEEGEMVTYSFSVNAPGTYTFAADNSDTEDEVDYSCTFSVSFTNSAGEAIDSITEPGEYTVTVSDAEGNAIDTAVLRVRERESEPKEITVYVKETNYYLDKGFSIDPVTDLVYEVGDVLELGHTLEAIEVYVNEYRGVVTSISSWKVTDAEGNDVSALYTFNLGEADGYNIVHIFDNVCDPSCGRYHDEFNYVVCDVERAVSHSGGKATCCTLAVCENCGYEYGEVDPNRHFSTLTACVPDSNDLNMHSTVYACCGAVISSEEHTVSVAATCSEKNYCELCDSYFGELDPDNHTEPVPTYTANADGQTHKAVYSCCSHEEDSPHSGGEATCVTLAVCEHCSASYGELDPENHETDELRYDGNIEDNNLHKVVHVCCEAYTTEPHTGGEANCTAGAVCELCNIEYGEKNPDNHASEEFSYVPNADNPTKHDKKHACCGEYITSESHSGGEATCNSVALCEHCSAGYGAIDRSNHASDEFNCVVDTVNPDMHNKYYSCCGEYAGAEKHSGGTATCIDQAKCSECSASYGDFGEHVYDNNCDLNCNVCLHDTRAMKFHTDENGDGVCDVCGDPFDRLISDEEANNEGSEAKGSGGCGSSVTGAAFTLIASVTAGAVLVLKRKKEK